MQWLNFHHLLYFWTVVREGSVSKAATVLRLSQPTVSAQVRMLERSLGAPLFVRKGRGQMLTDVGQLVYRYADQMFGIGRELMEAVQQGVPGRATPLVIGIADAVPKLIAYRLLRPAMAAPHPVRLVCREGDPAHLIGQLATHALDVVIANAPAPAYLPVKVFNHLLGESDTAFFAPPALAGRMKRRFPASLHNAPMLLPVADSPLRRELDSWFDSEGIRPKLVAEFDDSALMAVFGHGAGCVFPAPAAIQRDVTRVYGSRMVGHIDAAREHYYAISAERRLKHAGVLAITSAARDQLFTP
jgi:LysR family transcriptional activator of nhaA